MQRNESVRLEVSGRNELAVLAESLRKLVDSLDVSLDRAREEMNNSRQESRRAHEAMASAEKAAQEAEAKRTHMMRAAGELEEVVPVLSAASDNLSDHIRHTEHGVGVQAQRIQETSVSMEEMNNAVLEVARNASHAADLSGRAREGASHGALLMEQTVESIRTVQRQSTELKEDMLVLGKQAEAINQIMSVISDIADQTNLLALNAAIEAARADEAGRGFAVVADEVRKLAEKTMASTTQVGTSITAIQQSVIRNMQQVDTAVQDVSHAVDLAGESGGALSNIAGLVEQVSDQVRTIATASEQQSASSEEINRSISEVNSVAAATSSVMRQSAQSVEELAGQSRALTGLIAAMRAGS